MEVLEWEETAAWLRALTGFDLDGDDVQRAGERIVNLERLFNSREGIGRKDDSLPARFLGEPLRAKCPSGWAVLELEPMLNEYYRARGWDVETGLPSQDKLQELGLNEGGGK